MAAKKVRKKSAESIAKLKATLAAKKDRGEPVGAQAHGKKKWKRTPEAIAKQKATLARKKRGKARAPKTEPLGDGPSSIDASITDLLQAIITATSEIARRLSQLTL